MWMRATQVLCAGVVLLPALACGGPVCDLDRILGASVELTSTVRDYDAVVELSDNWLLPVRPLEPSSGMELEGVALEPVKREPVRLELSCRDGVIATLDGASPEARVPCDEGFGLRLGLEREDALPAEARVQLRPLGAEEDVIEPAVGHAPVVYDAVMGSAGCGPKGLLGVLLVDTQDVRSQQTL